MTNKSFTQEDLQARLSPEQIRVTQTAGTERAFSGEYWDVWDDGTYHCIVCDAQLFTSTTKFDAGCGWPSFDKAIGTDVVTEHRDVSAGMVRTEVVCTECDAHLGHVFPDGPTDTGLRYCMNSASIRLQK